MVAVINNFVGFYSTELYFHELKRAGAKLHAPCVNSSEELTLVNGCDVYIGFIHVHKLKKATIESIITTRNANGPFTSLEDFIERTKITIDQITLLIRVDAF